MSTILTCYYASLQLVNWQVEKTLYKHSAGISAMAMHPTGKLCFTAGKVCDVYRLSSTGWDPLIVAENLQCFCDSAWEPRSEL